MLKEIRDNQPQKSINSHLGRRSMGDVRTLAWHMLDPF